MHAITIDEELLRYRRDGWCLFRRLIPEDVCDRIITWLYRTAEDVPLRPTLEPEFEATIEGMRRVRKLRRLLWNDQDFWLDMLSRSGLLEVMRRMVPGRPAIIFHAAFMKPGQVGSPVFLHQDQALWLYDYPGAVSIWVSLTDARSDNGCLQLCPGSHIGGIIEHRSSPDYAWHLSLQAGVDGVPSPIEIPTGVGDVVVWHRYMVHGSNANLSDDDRIGMVIVVADASAPGFRATDLWRLPVPDTSMTPFALDR